MAKLCLSQGAGRTTPGKSPRFVRTSSSLYVKAGQLNLRHTRKFTLRNPSGMTKGSATTRQPFVFSPVSRISNRNFCRLEFAVTHRKHSPDPKSNRNFRNTGFHASHAVPGVRKVAPATYRSATRLNWNTTMSRTDERPSQTQSVLSNRHWMRLEIAVTHTKHSLDSISNRHKNSLNSVVHPAALDADSSHVFP
jgi:hypothetical protein